MGVGALLVLGRALPGKSHGYLTPGEIRDEEEVAAVEARPPHALLHAVTAAPQGSAPAGGSDSNAHSEGAATSSPTCVQSCKEQSLLPPGPAVHWHPTCAGSSHIPSCASTTLGIALLLSSPKPGPPCHLSAPRCCSSCSPPPCTEQCNPHQPLLVLLAASSPPQHSTAAPRAAA